MSEPHQPRNSDARGLRAFLRRKYSIVFLSLLTGFLVGYYGLPLLSWPFLNPFGFFQKISKMIADQGYLELGTMVYLVIVFLPEWILSLVFGMLIGRFQGDRTLIVSIAFALGMLLLPDLLKYLDTWEIYPDPWKTVFSVLGLKSVSFTILLVTALLINRRRSRLKPAFPVQIVDGNAETHRD